MTADHMEIDLSSVRRLADSYPEVERLQADLKAAKEAQP